MISECGCLELWEATGKEGWVPSRVSGQRGVGYGAGAVPDVEVAKRDHGGMHTQMLSGGQTTVGLCDSAWVKAEGELCGPQASSPPQDRQGTWTF